MGGLARRWHVNCHVQVICFLSGLQALPVVHEILPQLNRPGVGKPDLVVLCAAHWGDTVDRRRGGGELIGRLAEASTNH